MQTRIRTVFLFVLWLCVVSVRAASPVEIWITPTGSGGGTGTATDPFSAPTADSFFDLIHGNRSVGGAPYVIPENSTIHLMPGTFWVRESIATEASGGQRWALTPKNGWKIRGAGMDVTILKLINNHTNANTGGGKVTIIGGNGGVGPTQNAFASPVDRVEVSDLTVDCNLQGQSVQHCPTAITLLGSDNRISRVRAIYWGSTKGGGYECFPLGIGPHDSLRSQGYRNGVIEDCIVDQPAPVTHTEGTSGIIIGGGYGSPTPAISDQTLGGWIIRGCTVKNITTGSGSGQPPYFNGFGGFGRGCDIHNNFAINLLGPGARGSYSDSWDAQDIVYRDNSYLNVSVGILYTINWWETNLVFLNNLITMTNGGSGIALEMNPAGKGMRGVRIDGNVIHPHVPGSSGTALAINRDIEFTADNNILDGGPSGLDFFTSGTNYLAIKPLSFQGNRNLRGKPLKIGDYTGLVESMLNEFYEEQLVFTPTNSGWYKIALSGQVGFGSGRLNIFARGAGGVTTDLGLTYWASVYDVNVGELSQLYNNGYFGGAITDVRLAYYTSLGSDEQTQYGGFGALALEVLIPSALVGTKITARFSGMYRPPLGLTRTDQTQFDPYLVQSTPLRTRQLTITAGIGTTGPMYASAFNTTSDRHLKENFAPANPQAMLAKVLGLPLQTWNFKNAGDARHLGPTAQDFRAAFGLGEDDKHIATADADGVALAAIQGLDQKLEEQLKAKDARIVELEKAVSELRTLISDRQPRK